MEEDQEEDKEEEEEARVSIHVKRGGQGTLGPVLSATGEGTEGGQDAVQVRRMIST